MTFKKGQPPACKKCGRDHWLFIRCENADAFRGVQEKKRERAPQLMDRMEAGWSRWGDRLTNYERTGDSLVLKKERDVGHT